MATCPNCENLFTEKSFESGLNVTKMTCKNCAEVVRIEKLSLTLFIISYLIFMLALWAVPMPYHLIGEALAGVVKIVMATLIPILLSTRVLVYLISKCVIRSGLKR